MIVSTSVNEEYAYWAVTHRSSACMKLRVPSFVDWLVISVNVEQDW